MADRGVSFAHSLHASALSDAAGQNPMRNVNLLERESGAAILQGTRGSVALLESVVETMPECIKVVMPDGRLLHMNAAGLGMIEADSWDHVAGASTFELIAPEHRQRWIEHHERVCRGERLSWEFDMIGLGGTRRHMETRAAPISLDDGSVGQLAVTRDISARKNACPWLARRSE